MKKLAFIIVAIVSLSSCMKKKDWNCSCDVTGLSNNGTFTKTIQQETQSNANTECTNYGKALMGGNGTYKCKITAI
ncbi:MAG: hypothetical protein KA163_06515 [Bacteroidia bacterium]|nr:hypothetical protein [Bacteroidia bacterium]